MPDDREDSTPTDPRAPRDAIDVERTRAAVMRSLFHVPIAPTRIGRFIVLGTVGAGAMGLVYAAWDDTLDRRVALKLIAPVDLSHEDVVRRRARLVREAKALARTNHPNIVEVYEVGTVGDDVFVAMELVDGVDLARWLRAPPRTDVEILRVFCAAGRGLAAAHRAGLVHRDFKPENVLVGVDGRVRVADFGLAAAPTGLPTEPAANANADPDAGDVTRTGAVAGTPAYMSPEQRRGEAVDARSDQFSFCVALHEALFGSRPVITDAGPRWKGPDGGGRGRSPRVMAVLARGLAASPAERFSSMDALVDALEVVPWRGWRTWAIVAVAAAGAVAAIVTSRGVAPACDGASAIAGAWDPSRAAALRGAFARQSTPIAADAAARAVAGLDDYGARWIAAKDAVCSSSDAVEGTSARLFDLRTRCLERARGQLDAVVSLLIEPDAKIVERAVDMVAALPRLEPCADVDGLAAGVDPPGADIAASVEEVVGSLAEVRALELAGRLQPALDAIHALVAPADATGYDPVRAEVRQQHGALLAGLGRSEDAQRVYLDAFEFAKRSGHDRLEAELWIDLARVAVDGRNQSGRADLYLRAAAASLAALGDPPFEHAKLSRHRARLAMVDGDHEAARAELDRALERLADDPDSPLVPGLRVELGNTLHLLGRYGEAHDAYAAAVAAYERRFGPDHLQVSAALTNLGANRIRLGDLDGAVGPLERALTIMRRALGEDSPQLGTALNALAGVHYARGAYAEALASYHVALANVEHAFGPDDVRLAPALANTARTLSLLGRHDEALTSMGRALALAISAHGEGHALVAQMHGGLASVLETAGRIAEAMPHAQAAFDAYTTTLGAEHPQTAQSRVMLARVLLAQGRGAEAREHGSAALAVLEATPGDPASVAVALTTLGTIEIAHGDPAAAVVLLERAVALLGRDGHPLDRQEATAALAQARALAVGSSTR